MDNRTRILSCALQLLAARGYDAVGVQEIADIAGVTKPTLYHYFGSKRGLLGQVLSTHFTLLHHQIEAAAEYRGDLTLTLNRLAVAYFDFAREHPLYYRFQLSLGFAPPESDGFRAAEALNEAQRQLLENLFLRAAVDHGNMRGRHRAYAASFLGMVNTYVALMLNCYAQLNDTLAQRTVHQFMHGIFS
jgi:TetR/AcrR family transcriptional regulator